MAALVLSRNRCEITLIYLCVCAKHVLLKLTADHHPWRWANGKQWFMGRRRTSSLWQNRLDSTWVPTRRPALPQGLLSFKVVLPLPSLTSSTTTVRQLKPATESWRRLSSDTDQHCQGCAHKALTAGTVFNTFQGHLVLISLHTTSTTLEAIQIDSVLLAVGYYIFLIYNFEMPRATFDDVSRSACLTKSDCCYMIPKKKKNHARATFLSFFMA